MLSFLVYALATFRNKSVANKYKALIALCILIEVSMLYYNIGDDPLFILLLKLAALCCILLPFLRVSSRTKSIEFDGCFADSYRSSAAYSYFTEMKAYRQLERFDVAKCGICLEDFVAKTRRRAKRRSLLRCGHMFHARCIEHNEQYQWNDDDSEMVIPFGKCPSCRTQYNGITEKFRFDPSHWSKVHPLQRTLPRYDRVSYLSYL